MLIILLVAAKGFGKFKESFLSELHDEILSHTKQEANGHVPEPVNGITITDSDVLEPEPERQGGLMRKDAVCEFCASARGLILSFPAETCIPSSSKTYRTPNSENLYSGLGQTGEGETLSRSRTGKCQQKTAKRRRGACF